MFERLNDIVGWAEARNLIEGSGPDRQFLKLMEEFGEVAGGIARSKPELIKDGVGDCVVVLTILAAQVGGASFVDEIAATIKQRCENWPEWVERRSESGHFVDAATAFARLGVVTKGANGHHERSLFIRAAMALATLARKHGLDVAECIEAAWDEIKDRKGEMRDGVWVKEADL